MGAVVNVLRQQRQIQDQANQAFAPQRQFNAFQISEALRGREKQEEEEQRLKLKGEKKAELEEAREYAETLRQRIRAEKSEDRKARLQDELNNAVERFNLLKEAERLDKEVNFGRDAEIKRQETELQIEQNLLKFGENRKAALEQDFLNAQDALNNAKRGLTDEDKAQIFTQVAGPELANQISSLRREISKEKDEDDRAEMQLELQTLLDQVIPDFQKAVQANEKIITDNLRQLSRNFSDARRTVQGLGERGLGDTNLLTVSPSVVPEQNNISASAPDPSLGFLGEIKEIAGGDEITTDVIDQDLLTAQQRTQELEDEFNLLFSQQIQKGQNIRDLERSRQSPLRQFFGGGLETVSEFFGGGDIMNLDAAGVADPSTALGGTTQDESIMNAIFGLGRDPLENEKRKQDILERRINALQIPESP